MKYEIPFFTGSVEMKSELSIEQVGHILSEKIFGGLKFIGLEECIYEEVPAIYIKPFLLGLFVTLQGYQGLGEDAGYCLEIRQEKNFREKEDVDREEYLLDDYLYLLLEEALSDNKDIILINDKENYNK